MLKIQLNNSNHRRIEFTEKSSHSRKEFFKLLEFLFVNIPEHHYFFDMEKKWCLLIATEGWIAYGEKSIEI